MGLPVPALILIILFAIFSAIANRTSFGRSVYTIGGNAEAAYLSGIPVAAVRTILFGLTGFLAGVSGLLQTSRLAAGNAGMGVGLEFAVITAVIVGGASLFGGKGSMLGTMLGGLFIAILNNAMVLFGVNSYAQYVANGVVGASLCSSARCGRPAALDRDFCRLSDSDSRFPWFVPRWKRGVGRGKEPQSIWRQKCSPNST